MKATTHTEVYRRFEGELRERPLRSVTLAWSGIRIGFKKKLPMLLLFLIPGIWTIVTSFMVQLKFEAEAGTISGMAGMEPSAQTMAMGAQWVTSAKADTETVYQITKALFGKAAQDTLAAGHAKGKFITKENAVKGVGIPFHPGAEK